MKSDENHLHQLESQLKLINEKFEREMRARGFDPDQAETAALPTALAQLYIERQSLIEKLDEIRRDYDNERSATN